MHDVTLTLTHDGGDSDSVKFTVLWVTVTTKHAGNVADDNAARGEYYDFGVPPSFALGFRLNATDGTQSPQLGWNGRGSEFIGTVAPSDFVPSQFNGAMYMGREVVSGNEWWGTPNGNENQLAIPAGSDTSGSNLRDDDPQSGGSNGKIYDLDSPGPDALWTPIANMIHRYRVNFRAWAVYGGIRCSTKLEWYTRQSYKLTGSVDTGTAESGTANTLTDNNKSWAANTWAPGAIKIHAGTGMGQVRRVTGNTATKITVATNWSTQPDGTSIYLVVNNSTWVQHNDVANDNQNADGTTNISWDLQ